MNERNDAPAGSGSGDDRQSIMDRASSDDEKSQVQETMDGGGRMKKLEGEAHVGPIPVAITALFLISLTVAMLFFITRHWPACELQEDNSNDNRATTAADADRNAQRPANANATSTTNANVNAAGNVNAGAGTPASGNAAAASSPGPSPAPAPSAATRLDADSIEPKSGPITGRALVVIKGKRFGTNHAGVTVKFDGVDGRVSSVSDESISVRTPPHSEGIVDVVVEKAVPGKETESDLLSSAYTYTCPAPTGSILFAMLVMAGTLGGCIHALRSLYWYTGNRELKWSWLPMYYILPFIGAAMAMIFSLLIFAGFVDNTTGRSQALFIIAVAGLVGMFSQQAALKLTDVANAFFTKPGKGKDPKPQASMSVSEKEPTKAAAITATTMSPVAGQAGNDVKITGSGFNTSTTVNFGGVRALVKSFDSTSITVLTPPGSGDVEVVVKCGDQSVKLPVKFKYN